MSASWFAVLRNLGLLVRLCVNLPLYLAAVLGYAACGSLARGLLRLQDRLFNWSFVIERWARLDDAREVTRRRAADSQERPR